MDRFRKFAADYSHQAADQDAVAGDDNSADQLVTAPAADQDAVAVGDNSAACPPPASVPLWGRGSAHYEALSKLRELRRLAARGKADAPTMASFRSGELDRRLEQMTKEHGAGRYWDGEGRQIDLRPTAFEDFLERSNHS